MALVQPIIIDLLPDDFITLNVPSGLGNSNTYNLVLALSIASSNRVNVDLKLTILDGGLYTFANGTTSTTFNYPQKRDNDTVDPAFVIKNVVPLTGMRIRFRVETNDVSTPTAKLPDTSQHDVIYQP